MKLESVVIPDVHPQLNTFIDDVTDLLNNGKYQMNVLTSIPTHTTEEGSTALYASGTVRRLYAYINSQWNYFGFLDSAGKILVDGEISIGTTLRADATSGMWLGHTAYASAPFRVSLAGALVATSATITGAITASSGNIAGWTIGATALTKGTGATAVGIAPGTYPFYAGGTTASSAPFRVLNTGLVELGDSGNTHLHLDGVNVKIESSDYVSGYAGAGFHLSAGLLEVGNAAIRGILRTCVFQKDIISAVGGNVMISKSADVLDTTMTALDAATLTIEGNVTFEVNDILRIKDGTNDEWMLVTNIGSAPTYTVTRDVDAQYGADNNPTWTKGATVVNYGPSGAGGVYITASETNAPYLSVFTHAGAPYDALTTRLRIGNLNGYLGYSSDVYGIAIGETNKYLKYDPTNGLRIAGALTAVSGARVEILPSADTNVGFRVYDDNVNEVFKILVAGTDVGDVIMGAEQDMDSEWKLMLHLDGDDTATETTDVSASGHTITFHGNAELDTAQKKFGTASLLLPGTTDYLSILDHADFNFGTGNFTVDFWIRFNDKTGQQMFVSQFDDSNNVWEVRKDASHKLQLRCRIGSVDKGDYIMTDAWAGLIDDTWYHLEFCRSTTGAFIFIDGVSQALTENTAFGTNDVGNVSGDLYIGNWDGAGGSFDVDGWMDEVRIVKGTAKHTADFTSSTRAYVEEAKSVRWDKSAGVLKVSNLQSSNYVKDVSGYKAGITGLELNEGSVEGIALVEAMMVYGSLFAGGET